MMPAYYKHFGLSGPPFRFDSSPHSISHEPPSQESP
jgi:hypothetical protein